MFDACLFGLLILPLFGGMMVLLIWLSLHEPAFCPDCGKPLHGVFGPPAHDPGTNTLRCTRCGSALLPEVNLDKFNRQRPGDDRCGIETHD
jgi:hypothetical protein